MGRAPCCDKANVKKGPWSTEEDAKLKAYIEEHGTGGNWIALPQKIGLKRCGKSCRLRWLNYLRPNIKHGGFSEEEDSIICNLYISIGSRWSIIAAQLPGRTDNDIKNYWNTKLKKRLLGRYRGPRNSISSIGEEEKAGGANGKGQETASQALSSSALERMQLHMHLQGLHSPLSFYNNPLLWPKFHPLAGGIFCNGVQQASDTSVIEPFQEPVLLSEPRQANWMSRSIQEDISKSNSNGLTSPSSNVAFRAEQSNLELESAAARLQAELHDLLYSEGDCFVGQEGHRPSELDCFRELDAEQGNVNWWVDNYFEEKSSPNSWE